MLQHLRSLCYLPWMGDFNDILYNYENEGKNIRCKQRMMNFRDFLDALGLVDWVLWFIDIRTYKQGVGGGEYSGALG